MQNMGKTNVEIKFIVRSGKSEIFSFLQKHLIIKKVIPLKTTIIPKMIPTKAPVDILLEEIFLFGDIIVNESDSVGISVSKNIVVLIILLFIWFSILKDLIGKWI